MRQVKLILTEAVVGLGDAGTMVAVKVGYARNFLLPQGKALLATESKVREFEHKQRVIADKAARELKDLQALRDRLGSLQLEVTARAGEEGKLFGSVTTVNIAELLAEKGFKIDEIRAVRQGAFESLPKAVKRLKALQSIRRHPDFEPLAIAFKRAANILKQLASAGILQSTRGAQGGYIMALHPARVSMAQIVEALEGPFNLVDCVEDDSCCRFTPVCPTHDPLQVVHRRFKDFMAGLTLEEILGMGPHTLLFQMSKNENTYLPR